MAKFRIDDILSETASRSDLEHKKKLTMGPVGANGTSTSYQPSVDRNRNNILMSSHSAYQQVETPLITATCRQPRSEEPKQREVTKWEKEMDKCDRKLCQTPDSDNDNEERSPSNDARNKKQRKPRTAFSDSQLQSLEKSFERQKYLSVQERMELAAKLQIADAQVKCWFQNRRTKWKRQNSMQFEAADLFPALRQMFPFSNFSVRDVLPTYRPQLPMFPTFENSFNPYLRPM